MINFEEINNSIRMTKLLHEVETAFEWDKWTREIPNLKFDPDWEIRIIPPYCGAVVRFLVFKGKAHVSVYLDCYEKLGHFGAPHWEMFPGFYMPRYGDSWEQTNERFSMHDTEHLLANIRASLEHQLKVGKDGN